MKFSHVWLSVCAGVALACVARAQVSKQAQPPDSSSSKHTKGSSARLVPDLDAGAVANGVYRNRVLGLSCKIPGGWVLRTEEMNAKEEAPESSGVVNSENPHFSQNQGEVGHPNTNEDRSGRVLLGVFSRPPAARGEDVNASIVIAVEKESTYPGLKEAAQYFGPLTEVAKAQGFEVDEGPYELQIGTKVVVRADFHKDVGSRVMRQSTLAFLAQGYAVSVTVIGGTEDEVEELIDGVGFGTGK